MFLIRGIVRPGMGSEAHPDPFSGTPTGAPVPRADAELVVDETYVKVCGRWRYLYRAIDRNGALVDVMLSERRDLAAA